MKLKKGECIINWIVGNAAEVLPELLEEAMIPDLVTDQTSAHDPLNGYLPAGYSLEEGEKIA